MKVTAAYVISLNGNFTKGEVGNPREWSSADDQEHYASLVKNHDTIIMGLSTYKKLGAEAEPERLRLVLTKDPEQYAQFTVPGQLEFVSVTAEQLIQGLREQGRQNVLLVGGGVNTQFLNAGLIDELYITVEPKLFGAGKQLFAGSKHDSQLRLLNATQLNDRGTLLLHYLIEQPKPFTM